MTRSDWLHAGLVAGAFLGLYALTAPRTIWLEDDALFVLSSYYLGIEHPPGYPLFTLIGHLFSSLPFGSIAYRVHLASAVFGALAGAAAWLCARQLGLGRLAAYLSASTLGLSPVFWSQSIIAEVYTLNAFFFLVLAWLALRSPAPLAWLALIFGLSLANHWPLMLLVAPAFGVLLWPMRAQLARRMGLLAALFALGLTPYVWLVWRSHAPLPISFYGPLETLGEIWYFVSRAGYADVDQSPSSGWMDRIKFFRFFATELALQFAFVGAALAAVGFAVQWRRLGRRVGAFLTIAFLMPSVVLIFLLGFDYNPITKHMFHVYPLPSYAVAALWIGLGFTWIVERYALRRIAAAACAAAVATLVVAVGARVNVFTDHEWGARYARMLLSLLPENAIVFTQGEADLGPLAYFHMIENERPDLTLYQSKGLVLGNRLFHPMRTSDEARQRIVRELIARESAPVAVTLEHFGGYARTERWLYTLVDRSSGEPGRASIDIPEKAVEFFEAHVAGPAHRNAWVAYFQSQLRRRYGELIAQTVRRGAPADERTRRHLEYLGRDFYGALGIAQGLMRNPQGYSIGEVSRYLDRARELMPSDAGKEELARFFHLRAAMRADMGDEAGAMRDFETAAAVWPSPHNPAREPLDALRGRLKPR